MTDQAKSPHTPPLEAPSDEFLSSFRKSGSIVMDCDFCGRTHFADNEGAGSWSPGELERLREKAKSEPDRYLASEDYSVIALTLTGRNYVLGCPCNKVRPYEDFIWSHRRDIIEYIAVRTEKAAKQAQSMSDLLSKIPKEA